MGLGNKLDTHQNVPVSAMTGETIYLCVKDDVLSHTTDQHNWCFDQHFDVDQLFAAMFGRTHAGRLVRFDQT